MPRLTLRRLVAIAAIMTSVLTAGLVLAVLVELMAPEEAALTGLAFMTAGALGVLALGVRRLDLRVRQAVEDRTRVNAIERATKTLTKRYTESLNDLTGLVRQVREELGEQRLELLDVMQQLDAERKEPRVGGAITKPRRSPIPPPRPEPKPSHQTLRRISGPGGSIVRTDDLTVALTFDDGPDPEVTVPLLDLLRRHEVTATFFIVGHRAHVNKEIVARIADEGHVLANHSWTHRMDLAKATDEEIIAELQNTNEALLAAAPNSKIRHFRAPGGHFDERLVAIAQAQGLQSLYWDVNPRDWAAHQYGTGAGMINRIVTTLKEDTRPGSIILSHDYQTPDTVSAYKILLPWLKDNFNLAPLPVDRP